MSGIVLSSSVRQNLLSLQSTADLLATTKKPSEDQIRTAMNGHLCRCGTYPRVMKAIQLASTRMTGATR